MTTLTNSEGLVITSTNDILETVLLQVNSSNNYYASGENAIICMSIGSNTILVLDYTYFFHRNIIQIIQYIEIRLMIINTTLNVKYH